MRDISSFFCMLSMYGKCESTDRDSVEKQYMNAADHFRTGRPLNKVNYLRTLRRDLLRTGVKAIAESQPDFRAHCEGTTGQAQ